MKFCVLLGSMNPDGNTAELMKPFLAELEENGCEVNYIVLAGKRVAPCTGCNACQRVEDAYGCVQKDDAEAIWMQVLQSDCLVLATPIHTWYCPAPMKALLDRHFALNKYYSKGFRHSLWAGGRAAIIATHGYDAAFATEPFEMGIQRLCTHSGAQYLGMYSVCNKAGRASFRTDEAVCGARAFARKLISAMGE